MFDVKFCWCTVYGVLYVGVYVMYVCMMYVWASVRRPQYVVFGCTQYADCFGFILVMIQ